MPSSQGPARGGRPSLLLPPENLQCVPEPVTSPEAILRDTVCVLPSLRAPTASFQPQSYADRFPMSEAPTGHKHGASPQCQVWTMLKKCPKGFYTDGAWAARGPELVARQRPQCPILRSPGLVTSLQVKLSRAPGALSKNQMSQPGH